MLRGISSRSQPLVLVVDQEGLFEHRALARYFNDSSLAIYEASDEFDVIDELCDFTVRDRPDVITVTSASADFKRIADLINQSVGAATNFPVFLYSDSIDNPSTFHSIIEIEDWLNRQDDAAAAIAH